MKHLDSLYLKFFILLLGISGLNGLSAQKLDTSSNLAIIPFSEDFAKKDDDTDYGRIFAEKTMTAFEQSRRFNIIDRNDFETINKEIALWEGKYKDEFKAKKPSNEALYWYGHRLKADFILTGSIASLDAPIDMITGSYKATIGFSIKVINIRTNKVYITEDFSVKSGNITKTFSSKDEAIGAAMTNMQEPIKEFVDRYFPIYAKYLRTEDPDRRGEMSKVLINGGTDRGFRLGQKLDIVLSNEDGLPPQDVGDAEIIAVQPEYSSVKIKSIKKGVTLETMTNKKEVLYFRSKAN